MQRKGEKGRELFYRKRIAANEILLAYRVFVFPASIIIPQIKEKTTVKTGGNCGYLRLFLKQCETLKQIRSEH